MKLQRLIRRLKELRPLCPYCAAERIVRMGDVRDHIVPLAEGGQDIEANTQMVCHRHHNAKSKEEAERGKQRATGGPPNV